MTLKGVIKMSNLEFLLRFDGGDAWTPLQGSGGPLAGDRVAALVRAAVRPPDAYVLRIDGEVVDADVDLPTWIVLNELPAEVVREIRDLAPGRRYEGGGGAAPTWSIEAVDAS